MSPPTCHTIHFGEPGHFEGWGLMHKVACNICKDLVAGGKHFMLALTDQAPHFRGLRVNCFQCAALQQGKSRRSTASRRARRPRRS